jgi:hypothetical protein
MTLKRAPLKRRPRRRKPKLSDATKAIAYHRSGGVCACRCGRRVERDNPAIYHHVFPKQRWPELIDNPDNVVCVAVDCHANHEVASRRLPRRVTRRAALLAEGNPSMLAYLDRVYGGDE